MNMIPALIVAAGRFALTNGVVRKVGLIAACTVAARVRLRSAEVTLTKRQRECAARFEREEVLQEQEGLGPNLDPDAEEFDRRVCQRLLTEGEVGRTRFLRHWVAELRVEFPARLNRPSDRAAMSKWLAKRLREHGVRVAHIADMVPRAVALAINPSRAEVLARQEAEEARIRSVGGRLVRRLLTWLGVHEAPHECGR